MAELNSSLLKLTPGDTMLYDLNPLHATIGEARVVMLGLPVVGAKEMGEEQLRMIRFLHEQMGFDLIVTQENLYDAHLLLSNVDTLKKRAQQYGFASDRKFYQYVLSQRSGAHPITMEGINCYFPGPECRQQFVNMISGWADSLGLYDDPPRRDTFRTVLNGYTSGKAYQPSYEELRTYLRVLDDMQQRFRYDARQHHENREKHWRTAVIQSLQTRSEFTYYYTPDRYASDTAFRSRPAVQSGSNLLMLINEMYPHKKVLVLCSNSTLLRSWSPKKGAATQHEMITVADMLAISMRKQVCTIAFTAGGGHFRAPIINMLGKFEKPEHGSLEYYFRKTKQKVAIADLRKAPDWLKAPMTGYLTFEKQTASWPEKVDLVVFFRKTHLEHYTQPN